MREAGWNAPAWLGLWLALLLAAIATRPLLPIDETRYASVVWEMWLRHSVLVPYVNGAVYSDKPPLLFWLILAGWKVFGVREWWVRLVAPGFALASLFLTAKLAAALWPERLRLARTAPWLLLGTVLWSLYGTLLLFDMLVAFFTLIALLGLVHAWRRGGVSGWLLYGLALGLGVLSKGPVVLVYMAPAALAAPWWGKDTVRSWGRWYAGFALALGLGTAIALAWALPAARAGGEEYAADILWQQTSGRLVQSFAHRRPGWWYLPLLPLAFFPGALLPAVWRGLARLGRLADEPGTRFCLAWLLPSLVILSVISGKQIHYLIPLLPGVALLTARVAFADGAPWLRWDHLPVSLVFLAVGLGVLVAPRLTALSTWLGDDYPLWLPRVGPGGGVLLVLAGLALLLWRWDRARVQALALAAVFWLVVLHLAVMRKAAPAYDARPAARWIHRFQNEGRAIANVGTYHSQFQFLGRLERPVEQIRLDEAREWMARHSGGKLIGYHERWPPDTVVGPDFVQRYNGRTLAIWGEEAVLQNRAWPPLPGAGTSRLRLSRE